MAGVQNRALGPVMEVSQMLFIWLYHFAGLDFNILNSFPFISQELWEMTNF